MRTSIATVSISGSLEGKLRAVAEAGFDGVEIFENDLLGFPGTPREVGRIIRDLGMQCTLFQPFRDLEGMPPEQLARAFERMERKFDVMAELGTDLHPAVLELLAAGRCRPAAPDRRLVGARRARRQARHARRLRGARLGAAYVRSSRCVEPRPRRRSSVDRPDSRQLPFVGARHSEREHRRSSDVDKLFFVQIADAPRLTMDYLSWSRHFRNMPGQGELPLAEFARSDSSARVPGLLVAGDLQRPVSRGLGERRRRRRLSIAAALARRGGVAAARADQAGDAAARRRQRRGVHRVRGERRGSAGARQHALRARASCRRRSTAAKPLRVGSKATSTSS